MMLPRFLQRSEEAQRQRDLMDAKAIVELEETDGWKRYTEKAEALIAAMTPNIHSFSPEQATQIAAQMAFVSGIRRCIGLMEQQKDILASLKKPEE